MNTASENKLIPAPLDEKNVTTDWIEMVFDDYNCTCGGHKDRSYVGFVNECAVLARIHNNSLWWNIMHWKYNDDKVQETYRILLEKRQGVLETQMTSRFREYCLNYDIKLSSSEKNSFVSADCNALKQQVNMIKTQIMYFEECVKTLDNFGFAVRNKLEMLSQQLM